MVEHGTGGRAGGAAIVVRREPGQAAPRSALQGAGLAPRRVRRRGRQGVALVAVLGVLAFITVLALHLATVSEVTGLEAKVISERGELKYVAESAAARAFWMLINERKNPAGSDADGASSLPGLNLDPEFESWRADGTTHQLEYGNIDISIRLRAGRPLDVKKAATQAIFDAAEAFLAPVMARRPLALSLEMRDIDPDLSPKTGTIRDYLKD